MISKFTLIVDISQHTKHLGGFFSFVIHHKEPFVQIILLHLSFEQNVYFNNNKDLFKVTQMPNILNTMFTQWMVVNQHYGDIRQLLYIDFPTTWVLNIDFPTITIILVLLIVGTTVKSFEVNILLH